LWQNVSQQKLDKSRIGTYCHSDCLLVVRFVAKCFTTRATSPVTPSASMRIKVTKNTGKLKYFCNSYYKNLTIFLLILIRNIISQNTEENESITILFSFLADVICATKDSTISRLWTDTGTGI
jgi:hypothetical protein